MVGFLKYNYVLLNEGFYRWLETNYLPIQSQILFLKLIHLFNLSGWSEWLAVDNQRLMSLVQTKREQSIIQWRDKLIENNLIFYIKGKKSLPNKYKLNNNFDFISEAKSVVETVVKSVVKNGVESVVQTVDIYKQNKTKQNINKKETNKEKSCNDLFSEFTNDKKTIELLKDWLEIRKAKRAATTTKAIKLNLGKLGQLANESNLSINSYLEEIIRRGWKSFYVINGQSVFKPSKAKTTNEKVNYDLKAYEKSSIFDPETEK